MYCINNNNATILIGQNIGSEIELTRIFGSPPITKVAIFIELTSHIIETMCHFMSDNNTDSSVIDGIIGIGIKEWWLQNTCWKTDFIGSRVIISVHGLRAHIPYRLIDLLAYFFEHISRLEFRGVFKIFPVTFLGRYFKGRIIAPFVGIPYFDRYRRQFFKSTSFGFFAHPIEMFDVLL